jgi:hypothetical protein
MRHTASLLVPGLESFHTLGGFGLILSHFENDPHHGHTIEAEIDGLIGFNMNPLGITAQEKDVGVRNHMIARSSSQPEIIVAQEFHGRTTIHLKAEMSKARSMIIDDDITSLFSWLRIDCCRQAQQGEDG